MNYKYKLIGVIFAVCLSVSSLMGQALTYDPSVFVDININSGNPSFPYPQFMEYKGGGKSLAKYNAEGVTHADMEKAGREAYQIMSHRCRYFGGTHCGVKYIVFNSISNGGTTETSLTYPNVEGAYGTFCSEGDGYMLLAAALFADQKTYNGLYMWIHDNRFSGVKRFKDGKMFRENKQGFTTCPYLAGWGADETTTTEGKCHSAADGDVDIAMATLIAYKQWGEFMKQDGVVVNDANGDPISYLHEAQRCVGALVDTVPQWEYGANTLAGYLPGVIGIDGYTKDGVAQGEVTRWRFSNDAIARYGNINGPYNGGPVLMSAYGKMFADYDAPAYYDEFWKWFDSGTGGDGVGNGTTNWRAHQFKKAAASGNWITKTAYDQGYYASIGKFSIGDDGSNPTFGVSGLTGGEDFRFAWRHLLDYLWHGETAYDWDPKDHSVIEGQSHDGVKKMGLRYADLMKNPPGQGEQPGTPACSKLGASPDAGQPMWSGVVQNPQTYNLDGTVESFYHTNYTIGAGSPAAVISEDLEFLGDMYRSLELRWDGNNTAVGAEDEERYIGSTPKYFHGWYRTLGMLVCQGNMHSPSEMQPIANMKVYMSVDKTYAYVDDKIDYTVQYRNYGTLDAEGVKISTDIDPNYEVVKISNGGTFSGGKIVWNIGSVKGFKSGHLAETIDSVSFTVVAKDTVNPRICLISTISGTNFPDWVSNEYPNHATYTMERNCVDILANRTLTIDKTASRYKMNPGDVVAFTVNFENKSEGESSWLNGGRDDVRLSYGNYMMSNTANLFYQYYRFWNDATEAYINLGNYRVSYFMYDAASIGLYDNDNPTGWQFELDNENDMAKYGWMPTGAETKFTYQKMPNGEDEHGKWNQRIMIQFPSSLMAATPYVYDHLNNAFQLHKGGYGPCFFRTRLGIKQAKAMYDKVNDDWSYSPALATSTLDGQTETYTLISPGWANFENPGYDITNYARNVCNPKSVPNYERVLIEEFDGYTWRRIQGTGPLPGREANDVTIIDTIPYELEWVGWKDSTALKDDAGEKIKASYIPAANPKTDGYTGIVKWTTPVMLVGEKDKLVYVCKARDLGCPDVDDTYYKNVAWISSKTDSPDSSQVDLMTTCAELPPVIDPQSSLFKSANKKKAMTGESISYSVKFVNIVGTNVKADCKKPSDWVALNGASVPSVGTNGLALNTNGSSTYFFAPTYSYGTDGDMYVTFSNANNTKDLFLVMRYVSGTPGQPNFKGVCIRMKVNLDGANNFGYDLYNDGTLVAAEGTSWQDVMQFMGSSTNPTFKFTLKGDKLYMYCNDQDDEWINVMKDWSGLTTSGPGYFGAYTNSNGNGQAELSGFETELDYAFNVTLFDQLPKELGNITNISDNGNWDQTKNVITWPTIAKTTATAMAPNDSVIYTFDSEVLSCNNYINNYGLATVYGLDTLKVLNTVECGSVDCSLDTITISVSKDVICEGDSAVLKAVVTPKGKYDYEYYFEGNLLKSTKADSMVVYELGSYMVKVYDLSTFADSTCFKQSEPLTFKVDTVPDLDLGADVTLCANEKATLKSNVEADAYEWSDASTGKTLEVDKAGTYWLDITAGACKASDTVKVDVVEALVATLGNDTTLCYGDSLELNGGTAVDYEWSTNETTATILVKKTGEYILKLISGNCSASDTINVMVADEIKLDLGEDQSLCQGESATLDAGTADSYEWSNGETSKTIAVTEDGKYGVTVTVGTCTATDTVGLTFGTANLVGGGFTLDGKAVDGDTVSICPGAAATLATTYTTDAGTDYTWTSVPVDANLQGNGAEATIAPTERTIYYVRFTKKCEAVDSIVVDIAKPMKVTVEADTLCAVTKLTASTEDSQTAVFTWNIKGESAEETGATFEIEKATAESGIAVVTAKADDACASEPLEVPFGVVDLSIVVDGSPSVCPGGTTELKAIPSSTETAPAYTYEWTKDGVAQTETGATLAAGPGEYGVTVRTAYCEKSETHTVNEGSGELKGSFTVNGKTLYGMPKEYGTCGEELTIVADYETTGSAGFKWNVEAGNTTNTLTIQPNADTKVYLEFENQCSAYDTLYITMLDSVHATIAETRECGLTTLAAKADASGAKFAWAVGTDSVYTSMVELPAGTTAAGTVTLSATAEGYCPSSVQSYNYTVDTLSVTIDGNAKVCTGGGTALTATVSTTVGAANVKGQWSARKEGGTFAPLSETSATLNLTDIREDMELEYEVTAGTCTKSARFSIELLKPVMDGYFTLDGENLGTKKTVRVCQGTEIELGTHTATDEGSFAWTSDPADATMSASGRTLTAAPATTTKYAVSFTNECELSDTITVEVSTLEVTVDWSAMGTEMCEGGQSMATMELDGFDAEESGAYIYWTKDGVDISGSKNQTEISIAKTKGSDSGVYGWRVSNGICTDSSTTANEHELLVKPYVTFTADAYEYEVENGGDVLLDILPNPSSATITWNGTAAVAPYTLTGVTSDVTVDIEMTAENYCEADTQMVVRVDAKPVVTSALDKDKICAGDEISLTADTSGTGNVLHPEAYSVEWEYMVNGSYQTLKNQLDVTDQPSESTTYRVKVTYKNQEILGQEHEVTVYAPATYVKDAAVTICEGGSAEIGISGLAPADAAVKWETGETGEKITVEPTQTTTYKFTISQEIGCEKTDSVKVNVQEDTELSLSNDTLVCKGSKVTLSANAVKGNADSYTWTVVETGSVVASSASVTVMPSVDVTYRVTAGAGVCGEKTAEVNVTVAPSPVITRIGMEKVRTVKVTASGGTEPYMYKVGEDGTYVDQDLLDIKKYITYDFYVIDANGCETKQAYKVQAPGIVIEPVFTPDGDGINDTWEVANLADAYPDAVVTIYDRFGKKLSEMRADEGSWDGTYNGKKMPSTDYWYEINIPEIDKMYVGHFTLMY